MSTEADDPFDDEVAEESDSDLAAEFLSDEDDEVSMTSDIEDSEDNGDDSGDNEIDEEVNSSLCDGA